MGILDLATGQREALRRANQAFAKRYPGERDGRHPVHTVYGGAHLFRSNTTHKLGEIALRTMDAYGKSAVEFATGVGFVASGDLADVDPTEIVAAFDRDPAALRRAKPAAWLAAAVHRRVRQKLQREPVEDFRIDFEDGFGARSDVEEDDTARSAARELAQGMHAGSLPPFVGIRVKSFGEEWIERAARTLEIFTDALVSASGGRFPSNFVVTLPKVTVLEQPKMLSSLLALLERRHELPPGSLRMELMIEAPQALLAADGRSPLPDLLEACDGRCVGAHLGTYDFTAACNVTAAHQTMDHPMCDLARGFLVLAYAGRGIALSDGATNVMPTAPYAAPATDAQEAQNRAAVHAAWRLSYRHIRQSLRSGLYQGWDLHPAQLPVRYAACFAFFLEGLLPAAERLRNFVEKAAQATLVGEVFDDAATGQGLVNFFLRALNCGAIDAGELESTGLTREDLQLRSFAKILQARQARVALNPPGE